jgi:hypothetical protein
MDRDIEGLRRRLALHAHDPRTERCPQCGRAYCPPYAETIAALAGVVVDSGSAAVEVPAL